MHGDLNALQFSLKFIQHAATFIAYDSTQIYYFRYKNDMAGHNSVANS